METPAIDFTPTETQRLVLHLLALDHPITVYRDGKDVERFIAYPRLNIRELTFNTLKKCGLIKLRRKTSRDVFYGVPEFSTYIITGEGLEIAKRFSPSSSTIEILLWGKAVARLKNKK